MGYFYELMQSIKKKDSSITSTKTKPHPIDDDSVEKAKEHVIPIQKHPLNIRKS